MTTVGRDEAGEYYFRYIDQVPPGDIGARLAAQAAEVQAFCAGVTEEQSAFRYAPDKWSMREVLQHLIDTERLFVFRAFWFARGFDSPWLAAGHVTHHLKILKERYRAS